MNFTKSIATMNHFERLSEGCISEILSKTTPVDVVRSTILSKDFKSAAESDKIWERFLPSNYQEIIGRSEFPPVCNTKKELFFSLCDSPILLDGGKLSFFLDKHSGKKCFMIEPRELIISGSNHQYIWQWIKHPNSRFSEVAYFRGFGSLDICGKIARKMLSKKTTYVVYLVFKFTTNAYDGVLYGNSVVRFVNDEAEERREVRRISLPDAQRRVDEWMEIEIGRFFNEIGEERDVEARLMHILFWIGHLLIEGIEFRAE